MASLYKRGGVLWIKYKSEDGTWKRASTGFLSSNPGSRRQAKLFCREQTAKERARKPAMRTDWSWVSAWITGRWSGSTQNTYLKLWRNLEAWLQAENIPGPASLKRESCLEYPAYRLAHGGGRNTAKHELRLLSQVTKECVARGWIDRNPAADLRVKGEPAAEKIVWSNDQLETVARVLESGQHVFEFDGRKYTAERLGWMHTSFMLGWRQAVRLGQARAPISSVDLDRQVISWPGSVVKGGRGYTHPIDARLAPFMEELIRHRKAIGKTTLADVPTSVASLHWRKFLDSLGFRGISHHGLRTSWITNAAKSGIHESAACKFANHSQVATHRIYLKWADSDLADQLRKLL